MKKIVSIVLILITFFMNSFSQDDLKLKNRKDSVSYAVGISMYRESLNFKLTLDEDMVAAGYLAAADSNANMRHEEAIMYIRNVVRSVYLAKYERNLELGKLFLEKNREAEGVNETESGLQYSVIKLGTGEKPDKQSRIRCNYTGYLLDGTIFDSSDKRGGPVVFSLQQVIPGFAEALQLMPVGSEYILFIPNELAYKDRASGDEIEAGMSLMYEVELLEILDE